MLVPFPWNDNPLVAGPLTRQMCQMMPNWGGLESESEVAQSCPTLCDPWTVAHQAPPSMGFSRQEY